MNCGLFQLRRGAGAILMLLCGLLLSRTHAGERGRPIEFSEPKNDSGITNSLPRGDNRNALKRFEEDLGKSLQIFDLQNSLSGGLPGPAPPPAAPVIQSKRVRELLERRKNWMFASPEDEFRGLTSEGLLELPELGPDGREKKSAAPLEQYYESLARERTGAPRRPWDSRAFPGDGWGRTEAGPLRNPESDPVHSQLSAAERNLRALFDNRAADSYGLGEKRGGILPDLLGNPNTIPLYQQKAQEARQDQFRQMLQAPSLAPVPAASGLGSLAAPRPADGFSGTRAAAAPSAAISSSLSPGGWAAAPTLSVAPALTPVSPPATPPLRVPSSPFMELPKRRF